MNKHTKQIIGAVLSAAVAVFAPVCWIAALWLARVPTLFSLVGIGLAALWLVAGLSMLIQRIKEIRSGEEDDLSQY